jgi:hypothetical protein
MPLVTSSPRKQRSNTQQRQQFLAPQVRARLIGRTPTITFASLESHNVGEVRMPGEIDNMALSPWAILARYRAVEFACAEDTSSLHVSLLPYSYKSTPLRCLFRDGDWRGQSKSLKHSLKQIRELNVAKEKGSAL